MEKIPALGDRRHGRAFYGCDVPEDFDRDRSDRAGRIFRPSLVDLPRRYEGISTGDRSVFTRGGLRISAGVCGPPGACRRFKCVSHRADHGTLLAVRGVGGQGATYGDQAAPGNCTTGHVEAQAYSRREARAAGSEQGYTSLVAEGIT